VKGDLCNLINQWWLKAAEWRKISLVCHDDGSTV